METTCKNPFFFPNFKEQIWCWKPTCPSLARKFLSKWTNCHYWKQILCWCPSRRSVYPICFILKETLSPVSNSSKSTKIQVIFSLKLSSHCLSILLWNSSCSRWALDVFGRRNQQSLDDSEFYESAWQVNGNSILFLIELEITKATRCLKMFLFFLIKKEAKHYMSIQLICLTWNKMIHFRFDLVKLFIHLFPFKIYNMKKNIEKKTYSISRY